jgi:predicted RNA methylase
LEQYQTPPHLAARMIHVMASYGDLSDRRVLDLGCGCGMLSIAWLVIKFYCQLAYMHSAMMGGGYVVGVDLDDGALEIASCNIDEMDLGETIDLIHCDVAELSLKKFDTVVTNPPFGTRSKGADMLFLKAAIDHATTAVYSLHKTSTRQVIFVHGFLEVFDFVFISTLKRKPLNGA